YQLGKMYWRGIGVLPDVGLAKHWWKLAGAQHHMPARAALRYLRGQMLEHGIDFEHTDFSPTVAGLPAGRRRRSSA
ncbi:MAG: SEL1-like repeat protein, partial [Betaproteobacteria bacterium]|nr:SEL1-like repeat protein [Betaproteobacteria bacterium]